MAVLATVLLFGGVLCLGAAVAERRERARIQATGPAVWALVVAAPRHPEYEPSGYRPLLRFATNDGHQLEVFAPRPSTARRPLVEGRKILIHYNPQDPTHVVMHGGRFATNWVFTAIALAAIAAAVAVLTLA